MSNIWTEMSELGEEGVVQSQVRPGEVIFVWDLVAVMGW